MMPMTLRYNCMGGAFRDYSYYTKEKFSFKYVTIYTEHVRSDLKIVKPALPR